MANIESIIDKCCGVVTGAVALGLGVQSAGGILAATATGGLLASGMAAWSACGKGSWRKAVATEIQRARDSGEYSDAAFGEVERILAAGERDMRVSPDMLVRANREGALAANGAVHMVVALGIPPEDGAADILRRAFAAGIAGCLADAEFCERLRTALATDTNRAVHETRQTVAAVLSHVDGMSRPEMDELAVSWGIDGAAGMGLMKLKGELIDLGEKAQRVAGQIETLDGMSERIGNIRAAAADAVRHMRLAEARSLIRDARRMIQEERLRERLEQDAALAEQEAEVALLDFDPDEASATLVAAADAFGTVDPLEVARRKARYEDRLYQHGLRYGGTGIALAVDMNRAALTIFKEADHPFEWANTMQNLAIDLAQQGTRTGGSAGASLLGEAVESYRAALRVLTEADHPVAWATTMQNLAIALRHQGTRTGGSAGASLLGEAVESYRVARRVNTKSDIPVEWAKNMENTAILEQARADHDTCTDPRPHLEAGLAHVTAALTVYDPEHMPYNHDKATTLRDRLVARLDALSSG